MDFVPGPVATSSLLSFLLLVPVVSTLHLRRNALAATAVDRTAAWFAFTRSLRWVSMGSLILWWAAIDFTQFTAYTYELPAILGWGETTSGYIVAVLLAWLPMLAVMVLCSVLSQPVYANVRGQNWTRRDLAKLSLLRIGSGYLPVIIVFGLFGAWDDAVKLPEFLLWFGLAAAIYLASRRMLRLILGWKPEALTSGELRDAAFALSNKLGANLKQIYVMPAGKFQMANAFASSAKTVMLTDYLIQKLNKRELEAILAHELAHVKHNHANTRGMIMGAIGGALAAFYGLSAHALWTPLAIIGVCAAMLLTGYFLSRRFEYTADRTGARLTGDAESMISGLAKAHALNLMPVQWGKLNEKAMTHPSAMRRAVAIARATGFPAERVPEVVQSAVASAAAGSTESYTLPANFGGSAKVYSTQLKGQIAWRNYWVSLLTLALAPALTARGLTTTEWPISGWTILCVAAAATIGFRTLLFSASFSQWSSLIERRMRAKVETEGAQPSAWGGEFVGISPDADMRIYDGSYYWDVGYLFLTREQLCYWGEMARFALKREEMVSVRTGPGVPAWRRVAAIYVTWANPASGKNETFRIGCANPKMFHAARNSRALAQRLQWWASGDATAATGPAARAPNLLSELSEPAIGVVTSARLSAAAGIKRLIATLLVAGFLAGCASSLMGMPVDVAAAIARVMPMSGPDITDYRGWWVVLAACVAVIWSFAPYWIFRRAAARDEDGLKRAAVAEVK
jgi:Zn-dependent protease with chaperone function